jgi:hypothetical protein
MNNRRMAIAASVIAFAAPIGLTACGSGSGGTTTSPDPNAAEVNPPGDIPDNQVFVPYRPPGSGYQVKVPEGWAQTKQGGAVTFTDKLNSIELQSGNAQTAPTVSQGQAEMKNLAGTVPGFKAGDVSIVKRSAGDALLITYTGDGPSDPVTGKSVTDAFERYEFFNNGTVATLTLSGPQGADNVDPWMIVSDSLRWNG